MKIKVSTSAVAARGSKTMGALKDKAVPRAQKERKQEAVRQTAAKKKIATLPETKRAEYTKKRKELVAQIKQLTAATKKQTATLDKELKTAQAQVDSIQSKINAVKRKSGLTKAEAALAKLDDAFHKFLLRPGTGRRPVR